jgi:hypothetical protein
MKLWVGNPETWSLYSIPWQFFCTLTYVRSDLREPSHKAGVIRCTMAFAFWRSVARRFGVPDPRILWVLRDEAGEKNGAMHVHMLIGGLHPWVINTATCFWMMDSWKRINRLTPGDKLWKLHPSRVRMYEPNLPGVEYVCDQSVSPANAYETAKFGKVTAPMISKSVVHYLRSSHDRIRKGCGIASGPETTATRHQEVRSRDHSDVLKV